MFIHEISTVPVSKTWNTEPYQKENTHQTHNGHVPCVWHHAHWIPSEIIPHFDLSHLYVALRDQEFQIVCKSRVDTWRTRVTYLGPCPLDSWWNSTPFWPLTLVCSSTGSEVTKSRVNHVSTRDGHVSRVWDHAHWIPGEILPHFDVRHVLVAHLEPKLEICNIIEQGTVLYCTVNR
jgi:hypothetical protein